MRSLVWTFWIAMLLAILVAFASTSLLLTQWQSFQTYSQAQGRPHAMLHALAAEIEDVLGDEHALVRLLEDNQMSRFGRVYLIDSTGADVMNRPIPPDLITSSPVPSTLRPAAGDAGTQRGRPIFARAIRAAGGEQFFMIFRFDSQAHPFWTLFRRFGLTWMLIASVVVSGIFSALLASVVARPLKKLALISVRHGNGDLDTDIDERLLRRRDEIGELARQLATSAGKIGGLLQQQRDFLRDVSHEVRTPLSRLQVAAESVELDSEDERALAHIQSEVQVIDQLVQDLLHLSQFDRPLTTHQFERIDVGSLLKECVAKVQILAEKKRLTVRCDLEEGLQVSGVPLLMQRAVDNLLTNAVHHSPEDKQLLVVSRRCHGWCEIAICDEGQGVPEDMLKEIFRDFVRLDSSRRRETGGFGLGLSIVQRVAVLHSGAVEARNRRPTGLKISLRLPLDRNP